MHQITPWAVLLCKFNDNPVEPFTRDYYEEMFTQSYGSPNMVDYFYDISHGNLDLRGSLVFGWYTLNKKRSDYTGSGLNQAGRNDLINWARQAAIADGVDLSQFWSIVVCMNVPTDLFGGGPGVVCDSGTTEPRWLGQVMGYVYGLEPSRADGSTLDYQDRWDIMSVANAYSASSPTHPQFGRIGPGLNAANMEGRGWLHENKVWKSSGKSFEAIVKLNPLHRYQDAGFIAARFGDYIAEFRDQYLWDAGIPRPAVLIHRFEDNCSYLMSAKDGQQDLVAGSVFGTPDSTNPVLSPFIPVTRLEVLEIGRDEYNVGFARIHLIHRPAFEEPSLGPGIVFGGVTKGGDGFIFIGGKVIPIPPRSPLFQILEHVAAYQTSESIASVQIRNAVRRETLSAIMALAESQMQKMRVFRQPETVNSD